MPSVLVPNVGYFVPIFQEPPRVKPWDGRIAMYTEVIARPTKCTDPDDGWMLFYDGFCELNVR